MKVIFLDIDGVLNTTRTRNPRQLPYVVEKRLVNRLRRLVAQTNARVVLSSTWRYDPAGLYSAKRYGIPFQDVIPDWPHRHRRDEILGWLRRHPRTKRFAVLDDDDDELDSLPLFQPSASTGLTGEVARAVADFLNGKREHDMRRSLMVRFVQNVEARLGSQES